MDGRAEKVAHVTCNTCGDETETKSVNVTMWNHDRLVMIENVPARICNRCQEQFYDEATHNAIVRLVENDFPKRRLVREIIVPVFSLHDNTAQATESVESEVRQET